MYFNTRGVILSIESILFAGFIWALICWFKNDTKVKRWELIYIKAGGLLFMTAHLSATCLYPLPPLQISITGILLLLFSGGLFTASLLSFKQPPGIAFGNEITVELNTTGPYKFIRHPFYTSYSIAWIGGTIATGCWWLFISFLLMGFIYYKAATEEEQLWLQRDDANKYRDYMNKTGMFLFRFVPGRSGS